MKKFLQILIIPLLLLSCKQDLRKLEMELETKIAENSGLKEDVKILENKVFRLQSKIENKKSLESENKEFNYYRFNVSKDTEINVPQNYPDATGKIIDFKQFTDTLDISDNFYVYDHKAEIVYINENKFSVENITDYKLAFGSDFYVKVLVVLNGKSLPLETENQNENIEILIGATELGYQNKYFSISDFHNVEIITINQNGDNLELNFKHGRFPRKMETIIIKPELVKFKK